MTLMFDTAAFERRTDPILRFFTVEQAREIVLQAKARKLLDESTGR